MRVVSGAGGRRDQDAGEPGQRDRVAADVSSGRAGTGGGSQRAVGRHLRSGADGRRGPDHAPAGRLDGPGAGAERGALGHAVVRRAGAPEALGRDGLEAGTDGRHAVPAAEADRHRRRWRRLGACRRQTRECRRLGRVGPQSRRPGGGAHVRGTSNLRRYLFGAHAHVFLIQK